MLESLSVLMLLIGSSLFFFFYRLNKAAQREARENAQAADAARGSRDSSLRT